MHNLVYLGLLVVTMAIGKAQADNHDDWTIFPMGYKVHPKKSQDLRNCLSFVANPTEPGDWYGPRCGRDGFRYWNRRVMECASSYSESFIDPNPEALCKDLPIWAPLPLRRNWWTAKKKDIEAVESCAHNCTVRFNPVCGTDQKTYSHSCELQCASSRFPSIQEASKGFCKEDMVAPEGICPPLWQPVCGSNGVTYLNMCHLRYAKKRMQKPVHFHHMGDCVLPLTLVQTKCLENGCDDDLYKSGLSNQGLDQAGKSEDCQGLTVVEVTMNSIW